MQDFLLNIDNKEILIEILHHAIDYLIGNTDDQQSLKLCHKYGFQSPDDFLLTIRSIAQCYRNYCIEGGGSEADLLSEFTNLSPELQKHIPAVLAARQPEVTKFLIRLHNAQEHPLVESFDWDLRFILGDSSFRQNRRQVATVTFNCRHSNNERSALHFQMDRNKLNEFIAALEASLTQGKVDEK